MIPPLPSDIFRQGQVLNNTYEVEGVIGRGGTGEVYRARNQITSRVVAIKALSKQFSGNEDYVELMRREEQMRDVSHDAVVRYSECSRSGDGHVFLVMDFIDGPSLQDAMRSQRFDPRELLIVGHRVADGLVAAHRHGIVHRDLSPDNIILRGGSPERATIIDFGIAKDTASGARTIVGNDFAGKYEYAAPEQLEGRAEPRSDLYALGALMLAAFRGSVPFAGSTPGEIVRRKQLPLDTQGVPEPLKGVIDRLAAPAIADRPVSAEVVVRQIDDLLKSGRSRMPAARSTARASAKMSSDRKRRGGGGMAVLSLLLLVAAGGGGAWYMGYFDRFLVQPMPSASPYRLDASMVGGAAAFASNAPDPDSGEVLRRAFGTASGSMPPPDSILLAQGVPGPGWPAAVAAVIEATEGLEDWSVAAADLSIRVTGLAPDRETRETIAAAIETAAIQGGLAVDLSLVTGPRVLDPDLVRAAIEGGSTCGPLSLVDPPEDGYPLGATISARGDVSAPGDDVRVREAIAAMAGDRRVDVRANVLNEDLCLIRDVLPPVPGSAMSVRLVNGATGAANLTGVFAVGDNPVVDIELPATPSEGWLWVIVVDNTGKVFNLMPNINNSEHRLERVGTVEGGIRRVRVLWSIADYAQDQSRLAMRFTETDIGKSEIIAFLSRDELFSIRRPRDESVSSFAEALAETLAERPGNLLSIATRVLESRP